MKVLIDAYCRQNLGDDLFIYSLVQRYKDIDFYIFVREEYKGKYDLYDNLTVFYENKENIYDYDINGYKRNYSEDIIKDMDSVIVIGGSIFMQNSEWKYWQIERYDILFDLCKDKIPVFFIGCNFGPYYDEEYVLTYRKIFSQARDICFRDKFSYNLFKDIPNVRLASDVIFSLNSKNFVTKKEKAIGISLIDLTERSKLVEYKNEYLKKLSQIITKFYSKDYKINLFPFCKFEGDEKAVDDLMNLLSGDIKKKISIIKYDRNIEQFLKKLYSNKVMICTRFHSIVLALLFKQRFFPIFYSDKSKNMLDDINYFGKSCYIKDISNIDSDDLYKYLTDVFYKKTNAKYSINSSKNQFSEFDKLVNQKTK